jgi:hypothetical protein
MIPIAQIGSTTVRLSSALDVLIFESGLAIDADGSPHAYHPDGFSGLDALGNAGAPGNWFGLACDDHGQPFIQGPNDPAPGFYISQTALENPGFAANDPRRFIDSEKVPYIVLPMGLPHAPRLGAQALVINLRNGLQCAARYADVGPRHQIGEGSIALAKALSIPESPLNGGAADGILTLVFPS